jgi:hypothetical protein
MLLYKCDEKYLRMAGIRTLTIFLPDDAASVSME